MRVRFKILTAFLIAMAIFFTGAISYADAEAYWNSAMKKGNSGDWAGAIEDFNQMIRMAPENVYAYYYRGYSKKAMGDKDGAKEDYAKVKELDSEYAAQKGISDDNN